MYEKVSLLYPKYKSSPTSGAEVTVARTTVFKLNFTVFEVPQITADLNGLSEE